MFALVVILCCYCSLCALLLLLLLLLALTCYDKDSRLTGNAIDTAAPTCNEMLGQSHEKANMHSPNTAPAERYAAGATDPTIHSSGTATASALPCECWTQPVLLLLLVLLHFLLCCQTDIPRHQLVKHSH
jgi:hypothetical protein